MQLQEYSTGHSNRQNLWCLHTVPPSSSHLYLLYRILVLLSNKRTLEPGAQVLDIALSEAECHKKLLAVSLPGVDMIQNDGDQLTWQQ